MKKRAELGCLEIWKAYSQCKFFLLKNRDQIQIPLRKHTLLVTGVPGDTLPHHGFYMFMRIILRMLKL